MNADDIKYGQKVRYTKEFIDNVYANELRMEDQPPGDAERPLYNLYKNRVGVLKELTHQPGVFLIAWNDNQKNLTKVHIGNIEVHDPEEQS